MSSNNEFNEQRSIGKKDMLSILNNFSPPDLFLISIQKEQN